MFRKIWSTFTAKYGSCSNKEYADIFLHKKEEDVKKLCMDVEVSTTLTRSRYPLPQPAPWTTKTIAQRRT